MTRCLMQNINGLVNNRLSISNDILIGMLLQCVYLGVSLIGFALFNSSRPRYTCIHFSEDSETILQYQICKYLLPKVTKYQIEYSYSNIHIFMVIGHLMANLNSHSVATFT